MYGVIIPVGKYVYQREREGGRGSLRGKEGEKGEGEEGEGEMEKEKEGGVERE